MTRLLPLAVLIAAIVLFASELMTTFEFTPEGGEVQAEQQAADRHGNALMVVAVFAVIALAIADLHRLEARRRRGRDRRHRRARLLPARRPPRRQRDGDARHRPVVHRRRGGAARGLLHGVARGLGAVGHRHRARDDDPGAAARAAPRPPAQGRVEGRTEPRTSPSPSRRQPKRSEEKEPPTRRSPRRNPPDAPAPLSYAYGAGLPAVVGEGLVGLSHAVDVVLALPSAALL